MPRARSQAEHILEKLANLRQNIDKLNEKVKQVSVLRLPVFVGSIQLSIV